MQILLKYLLNSPTGYAIELFHIMCSLTQGCPTGSRVSYASVICGPSLHLCSPQRHNTYNYFSHIQYM